MSASVLLLAAVALAASWVGYYARGYVERRRARVRHPSSSLPPLLLSLALNRMGEPADLMADHVMVSFGDGHVDVRPPLYDREQESP